MLTADVGSVQQQEIGIEFTSDPPVFSCMACGRLVSRESVVSVTSNYFVGRCNRGCGEVEVAPRVRRVDSE